MKPVKKSEAIKVYSMKDKYVKSGVMWAIYPPLSLRRKFKKEYQAIPAYAKDNKELAEVINTITKWKLSDGKNLYQKPVATRKRTRQGQGVG